MFLALPADHPLARRPTLRLEDLRAEAWIQTSASSPCARHVVRSCHAAGFEPIVSFESDDYQTVQGLVAAGVGVALIPKLALAGAREDIAIRALVAEQPGAHGDRGDPEGDAPDRGRGRDAPDPRRRRGALRRARARLSERLGAARRAPRAGLARRRAPCAAMSASSGAPRGAPCERRRARGAVTQARSRAMPSAERRTVGAAGEHVEQVVVAGGDHDERGERADRRGERAQRRAGERAATARAPTTSAQAMCSEGIAASWSASWTSAPLCHEITACVEATTSLEAEAGNIRGGASG